MGEGFADRGAEGCPLVLESGVAFEFAVRRCAPLVRRNAIIFFPFSDSFSFQLFGGLADTGGCTADNKGDCGRGLSRFHYS